MAEVISKSLLDNLDRFDLGPVTHYFLRDDGVGEKSKY